MEVLPRIISKNQTSFMKVRNIIENVLLAQEIIKDINNRNKFHDIIVKLEMTKAYDRIYWIFLTKEMGKFGFLEFGFK